MNSMHRIQGDGFGHAGDLVPYINEKLRWEWPPIYVIAACVAKALKEHNANYPGDPLKIRWGGCWRDISTIAPTALAMEAAVVQYGAQRRNAGKKAFTDGPHFEVLS